MTPVNRAKGLSVARHLAASSGLSVGTGASAIPLFWGVTMDQIMGMIVFLATLYIAVVDKDTEALRAYQPGASPRTAPEGGQ